MRKPTHIPVDGLDHRGEPEEGLGDVGVDILHDEDARGLEHGVGTETTDNVGASLILLSSCPCDSFCSFVHTIQQLLPGFISRLCLGVLLIIS